MQNKINIKALVYVLVTIYGLSRDYLRHYLALQCAGYNRTRRKQLTRIVA